MHNPMDLHGLLQGSLHLYYNDSIILSLSHTRAHARTHAHTLLEIMINNAFKCSKKQFSQLSKIIRSKGHTTHSTVHDTCYTGVSSLVNNLTQFLPFRFQEMALLIKSSCLPSHIQSTEIKESCEVRFRFTSTQFVYLYVCEHASGDHLMS
jgi:hypothetical protein